MVNLEKEVEVESMFSHLLLLSSILHTLSQCQTSKIQTDLSNFRLEMKNISEDDDVIMKSIEVG